MINPVQADLNMISILGSPNESRTVEFKPSFPWPNSIKDLRNSDKAQETIASILAMSNLRDGGTIIVGVERDSISKVYKSVGVNGKDLATYDRDPIFEQVRNFGEPEPKFEVLNVEYDRKNFIFFSVQSFLFTPVICRNNQRNSLPKLADVALYIRTSKPATKRVSEPSELKEIIDLAVEKELDLFSARMQRVFKTMSHIKVPKGTKEDQEKFEAEFKDVP